MCTVSFITNLTPRSPPRRLSSAGMACAFPKGPVWNGLIGDKHIAFRSDGIKRQLWVDVGKGKARKSCRKAPEDVLPFIEEKTGVSIAALAAWGMPDEIMAKLSTPLDSPGGADTGGEGEGGDELSPSGTSHGPGEVEAEPDPFSGLADTMAAVESAGGESGIRRSSRKRSAPSMLDPAAELPPGELFRLGGGRATGQRRALAEETECMRAGCVATRADNCLLRTENVQLRQRLEAETRRCAVVSNHPALASLRPPS